MSDGPDRAEPAERKGDAARQERLAQALRANLKRRKAQSRGRAGAPEAGPPTPEADQ